MDTKKKRGRPAKPARYWRTETAPVSYEIVRREFGRIHIEIQCGFCGQISRGFLWSLYGSGKKCSCGALMTSYTTYRFVETDADGNLLLDSSGEKIVRR